MKVDLLNNTTLSWQDYGPDDRFNYPIGYGGAPLGHDGRGHIDLVYRWEPGKYCHFHRRLCEVKSTVLSGCLEVVTFEDAAEVSKASPQVGSNSHMPEGDVHMSRGGPEGATVVFTLYSPDDRLTQMLDEQVNVRKTVTIENVLNQFAKAPNGASVSLPLSRLTLTAG